MDLTIWENLEICFEIPGGRSGAQQPVPRIPGGCHIKSQKKEFTMHDDQRSVPRKLS